MIEDEIAFLLGHTAYCRGKLKQVCEKVYFKTNRGIIEKVYALLC